MALNHSSESGEANVNSSPKQENLYSQLIKKYVSKKLSDKSTRLGFVKDIDKNSSLTPEQIQDIENFSNNYQEFASLEVSSDTISHANIKRELASYLTQIQSKKIGIKEEFYASYDITPAQYNKYLSSAIDDISDERELEELYNSYNARHEFLLEKFGKKDVPNRKIFSGILHNVNIEERIKDVEEHNQVAFADIVEKLRTRKKIDASDAMVLFETGVFTTGEKQEIIESYMPTISLKDAIDFGLFDRKKADNIKEETLKSALDQGFLGRVNVESYVDEIDDAGIIVSTYGLFGSSDTQEALFQKKIFYNKFVSEFNTLIDKIEQKLAEESIQTSEEMIEVLSGLDYISGIENFREGSTIAITQKQKDKSGTEVDTIYFADIVSLASAGTFILKERGINIYGSSDGESSRQTYSQFIDYVTKGSHPSKIEVLSPEVLDHRIQIGDVIDKNSKSRFDKKEHISEEIKQLTEQIEERKKELQSEGVAKSDWEKDAKLNELYRIRDEKNRHLENVEEKNKGSLAALIDEIDADGKDFGFDAGTSFVTDDGAGDVFSVLRIDEVNQKVIIKGLKGEEQPSYKAFVEAYKRKNAKRVSKVNTFEDLFNQSDAAYKSWEGYKLIDGKIQKEGSKTKVEFNYLVPPAGGDEDLIKIHSVDGTMATISFGKVKDRKKFDKKEKKDVKVGEDFGVEKEEYRVPIGVVDHYIRKNKLGPRSLEEGKVKEEELNNIPKPGSRFGFANWFFQGMSIAAVVKGGANAIEQIKNSLSEGNEEKANAFALKVFGPLLGQNGKTDLQARLEQSQKKSMDEMIERLKGINSGIATEMIERWLLDPRTPEYMKEAGMFYMFEKYGALCAKQLYKYQGEYLWYQKMGGKIGDEVWVKVHASNNKDPKQNTTEEQLVYMLMKSQTRPGGFNGIKRRSKLDKELKAKRGQGKEEEWDTGLKDGGNERDVKDRLTGGLSEMESGNYPNAMGWLETVINKGGTMKEMNMIPFVMMFSGMAYHFEKDLVDKIKNFPEDSRMVFMTRFMSYPGDIDLVNNVIVDIAQRLDSQPKFNGIYEEALTIFNQSKDRNVKDKTKQENTIKFYEKYGEELTKVLYMLNTGDADDVNNKMVFFEKDTNSNFKKYYDKIEGYINADGNFGKNEGLMADAFAQQGTSGLDLYRASTHLLELRTGGTWAKHEAGPIMWKEIVYEFKAIAKRQYDPDPVINKQKQEQLLEMNLRKLLSAITKLYTDTRMLSSYNAPTGHFKQLNKWGVYFDELIGAGADSGSIKTGGNKEIINKFVSQIINHELNGVSYERETISDGKGGYEYVKPGEKESVVGVGDIIQGKANKIVSAGNSQPPVAVNDNMPIPNDDDLE